MLVDTTDAVVETVLEDATKVETAVVTEVVDALLVMTDQSIHQLRTTMREVGNSHSLSSLLSWALFHFFAGCDQVLTCLSWYLGKGEDGFSSGAKASIILAVTHTVG